MKATKRIVLILVVFLIVVFVGVSWYFSGQIVAFETKTIEEQIEHKKFSDLAEFGVEPEDVSFYSYKKSDEMSGPRIELSGWFIPGKRADAPTFIVLHGQNDNRIGALKYAGMLGRAGYAVLIYDQRYHGLSEGDFCTYGYYESYDVSAAIEYLETRDDCDTSDLGIVGESFGGAVAIMAAAEDKRIDLLVEDSAYPGLETVVSDYAKDLYGLPKFPLVYSALFLAGLRADFTPKLVEPIRAIENVFVPTLILHCRGDENIRPEYSQAMFDASGAEVKDLYYFDGCTHTMGYEDHTEEYEEIVLSFIEENMP
ncbi:MAG: alpha/beta fold hydrolase [Deltaproteobacteria bacterium]|nr:alpha/beta fold hydrolase [Candidatus Zymogenaceae bacterium]